MARQGESVLLVDPFVDLLVHKGWFVMKTHGNQFQEGFPDLFISHPEYSCKWVEVKRKGHSFTTAQKKFFPILLSNNVPLYICESDDLRGERNYDKRMRMYDKLFNPPNAAYYLIPSLRGMGI